MAENPVPRGRLRRNLPGNVHLQDITEETCVIGLMGQASRAMLGAVAPELSDLPFGSVFDVPVAGVPCRATRVSFVGELGYELTVPNGQARRVFDALWGQGARPMGHYAVEGCRIEKGFKHWGHDLGPEITPIEAGLGFTIDWGKEFMQRRPDGPA